MFQIEPLYALYLQFPNVQTDTRKLQPGDLFFALKGPNFNGNSFVDKALEMGAGACVVDEEAAERPGKTYLVPDVLTALQELARHHRSRFSIPFIAITGSNGKTTTKELIHAVLSNQYRTYTTEGNLNNHIGVPLTLLKIRSDAEFAVIEMGANHQQEIASYCRMAMPTHGLITNCGKAHLEGFGGEEGVRKGKGELFDFLRSGNGSAFVMWDYDYLRPMCRGIANTITYGTSNAAYEGRVAEADPFLEVAFSRGFKGNIKTQLVGNYNLPNVLAAVAVGSHFKVPEEKIRAAIEHYTPTNSRSQLLTKGSNRIILDAYNANPSSMKAAIDNFAQSADEQKILVLGAMAELGHESRTEHQALLQHIATYDWQQVLLVGAAFAELAPPYPCFPTAEAAGNWLKAHPPCNSSLLIKGSRSTGMERVVQDL